MSTDRDDRLDSWKAISDHLGRDARTLQRWERERGLPVHRLPGDARGGVYAFKSEIDRWLRAASDSAPAPAAPPAPPPAAAPRRSRSLLAIPLTALAVAGAWWWIGPEPQPMPASVEVTHTEVRAYGGADAALWTWRFPIQGRTAATPSAMVDSQEGGVYALAESFQHGSSNGQGVVGGRLWRLSATGETQWQHDADRRVVAYGATPFTSPWMLRDVQVTVGPAAKRLAVAWTHEVWWPSFVEVLTQAPQVVATFHNPGWIMSSGFVSDSLDHLVVAGVSNPHDSAMAALIDTNLDESQAPAADDAAFRCATCGDGRPLRYVVLPRSEVNRAAGAVVNFGIVQVRDGHITVRAMETDRSDAYAGAEVLYDFDHTLGLRSVVYGDRYWEIHAMLERDGRLSHSRAACPERDGPRGVLEWTPASGWRAIQ